MRIPSPTLLKQNTNVRESVHDEGKIMISLRVEILAIILKAKNKENCYSSSSTIQFHHVRNLLIVVLLKQIKGNRY